MTHLAIIDIDGVIVDNSARMAKAEEAKAAYRQQLEAMFAQELESNTNAAYVRKGINDLLENLFWQVAFTPELVKLDTLIEGVPQALEQIEQAGYQVLFLTSRPESMREATSDWFWSLSPEVGLLSAEWNDQLIMKPASQQFVKTITWKAGVVQMLAKLLCAKTVLFVDDDPANHNELSKYADSFGMLYFAKSLDEAVRLIAK